MKSEIRWIITVEHAGHAIPKDYEPAFRRVAQRVRTSHLAWDFGALRLAEKLAKGLGGELFQAPVSRLLIDTNRSLTSPQLFSSYTKDWSESLRTELIERYYTPYRKSVEACVSRSLSHPVRVLSVHSFVPILNGYRRSTQIGLLFRPYILKELAWASCLQKQIRRLRPAWAVHKNRPYRGFTDCFLNDLSDARLRHPGFVGLFLEANQLRLRRAASLQETASVMIEALKASV